MEIFEYIRNPNEKILSDQELDKMFADYDKKNTNYFTQKTSASGTTNIGNTSASGTTNIGNTSASGTAKVEPLSNIDSLPYVDFKPYTTNFNNNAKTNPYVKQPIIKTLEKIYTPKSSPFNNLIGNVEYPELVKDYIDKAKDYYNVHGFYPEEKDEAINKLSDTSTSAVKNFLDDHKGFNVVKYLLDAAKAKNNNEYSIAYKGPFDWLNEQFTASQAEVDSMPQAYAALNFEDKLKQLIDDIVVYDTYKRQLVKDDPSVTFQSIYTKDPFEIDNESPYNPDNHNNYFTGIGDYDQLLKEGQLNRPDIEKVIYRMLAAAQKGKANAVNALLGR